MNNLCEHIRQQSVLALFKMKTMQDVWPVWQSKIKEVLGTAPYNSNDVIGLGEHLYNIFKSTGEEGRGQGSLSGGGAAWEAFVCWYMNLCLLGSRAVVIKQSKALIPDPISHALTVKYNNFKSNTESDLIGIVFPDIDEYNDDLSKLSDYKTLDGVNAFSNGKLNYKPFINSLVDRDFSKIEVSVIQCKTNWNDNAQIPMLWDMIYRTKEFIDTGIVVGDKSYSIRDLKRFSYAFATLPSTKPDKLKPTSVAVQRVRSISGGNYWGLPSKGAVAENISEIFARNFHSANAKGLRVTLNEALSEFEEDQSYFGL